MLNVIVRFKTEVFLHPVLVAFTNILIRFCCNIFQNLSNMNKTEKTFSLKSLPTSN